MFDTKKVRVFKGGFRPFEIFVLTLWLVQVDFIAQINPNDMMNIYLKKFSY